MNLFYQPGIPENIHHLDEEESRHCIKVLRRRAGDAIRLTDGSGFFYDALITNPDPRKTTFSITSREQEPLRNVRIHIAISPTKNPDRMEWFVEKAVEIGVDEISFVTCEHTERVSMKFDRLKKIAVSAMKQSLKASFPILHAANSFEELVTRDLEGSRFIAHVDASNPLSLADAAKQKQSAVVLIGPEGDFSMSELRLASQNAFSKVSLGNSRLRTETAGLAACLTLNLVLQP